MLFCFALKDEKAGCFLNPFFVRHPADAFRGLHRPVNDPQSQLHVHAADYSLWRLGAVDEETGVLTSAIQHEMNLVTLKEVSGARSAS